MPTWRPTSGEKPWPNSTKSRFLRLPCAYSGMAFRRGVTTALIQWWKGRDSNPRPRHYEGTKEHGWAQENHAKFTRACGARGSLLGQLCGILDRREIRLQRRAQGGETAPRNPRE